MFRRNMLVRPLLALMVAAISSSALADPNPPSGADLWSYDYQAPIRIRVPLTR
jgi:hypothetical protein